MSLILGWLAQFWWLAAVVVVALAAIANPVLVWRCRWWILLAAVLWWGWSGRLALHAEQVAHRETKLHNAEVLAGIAEKARHSADLAHAAERAHAQALADIGAAYEKGKDDAKAAGDRVVADLRAGNLRLRGLWQGCEAGSAAGVPGPAAGPGERDEAAERRFRGAGDLVRVADAADAQLAACQAVILEDRK